MFTKVEILYTKTIGPMPPSSLERAFGNTTRSSLQIGAISIENVYL
jgi:hypothetical protein